MARNDDRSQRDRAGVGPDPSPRHRLVPLDELDNYSIGEGEPDIRGWEVRTLSGRELGAVEDLLVDPERDEIVMIEIELRDDGLHAEIPLRAVELDRDHRQVLIDSGDLDGGERADARARDRMLEEERARLRETWGGTRRTVRYGGREADTDDIIKRRRTVDE